MTSVLVLNAALAILVVGGLLCLLSWAIVSSRGDQLPAKRVARQPVPRSPRPHAPHPHRPSAHRPQQGIRRPVTN